jgi:hypothetical protein
MDEFPSSPEPAPEPLPEPTPAPAPPPSTSLMARLLNVFAVPGEVFEEVKASPFRAGNWLVPVLFSVLVGVLSALVIFSQPTIQQSLREQQEKALAQQVKAGKMRQADVDKVLEVFGNPTVLKLVGGVSAVVASVVRVFWWGLVLWLLGKWFLKVQFDFLKGLEVAGLAMMISVLGAIVSLLMIVNLGRLFATPSLALVVSDFDATRKSHLFLGAANLFSFWQIAVTSLGLAKLAGVPFIRAALLVFAFWFLQESLFILIGLGSFAL